MSTKLNPKGMSNVTALLLMVITAMSVVIIMFVIQGNKHDKGNVPNISPQPAAVGAAQSSPSPSVGTTHSAVNIPKAKGEQAVEKEINNVALSSENTMKSCVIIDVPGGSGTGFLYEKNGKLFVVTCFHVIGNAPAIYIRDMEGNVLNVKEVYIAKDRDIAFISLKDPKDKAHHLASYENVSSLTTLHDVICYGNSGGESVLRQSEGKIKGIGPMEIEIDAPFIHGDSGGPVILKGTDKVIGVVGRGASPNEDSAWIKGTPFEGGAKRRMAVRFDNLKMENLEKVEWGKVDPFDANKLNDLAKQALANNEMDLANRIIYFNALINNDNWAINKTYESYLKACLDYMQGGNQAQNEMYSDAFIQISKAGAEKNIPSAQLCLGVCYLFAEDHDNAFQYIRLAANQYYEDAYLFLGLCYMEGLGTEKNVSLGLHWYRMAADAGQAVAQRALGEYYCSESGIYDNYSLAVPWFEKAANGGDVKSMEWLGFLYANGWGVTADLRKSIEYYKEALDRGSSYAAYMIGMLFYNKMDYANAKEYFEFAWQSGQLEEAREMLQIIDAVLTDSANKP